eukprot:9863139-Karenia_brevis.AAC.1
MILVTIAGLEKRHSKYLQFPYALFGVGDSRRSAEDRWHVATSYRSCEPCCLPQGLARDLQPMVTAETLA